MLTPKDKVAQILPVEVRRQLIAATQIENDFERRLAIEDATHYARWRYPQFFKPE